MNPLLALLAPQVAATVDPSAAPAGLNGSLVGTGVPNTAVGTAAVQVDSSAFLDILTATNQASSASAAQINQLADDQVFKNPLAELTALLQQKESVGSVTTNTVAGSPASGETTTTANTLLNNNTTANAVNAQTANNIQLPQGGSEASAVLNVAPTSTSSIETVASVLQGEGGETSSATVASDLTVATAGETTAAANAAYAKGVADSEQKKPSELNPKIVRAPAGSIKTVVSSDQASNLSNSNKLLNTFEGVTGNQPPANADVIDTRGTLAGAAKAYLQFEGKPVSQSVAGVALPGAESLLEVGTTSIGAGTTDLSSSGVTLNNLTQVDSARSLEQASSTLTQKAHASYASPAEQANIKIANAINEGVRHITIELEPARLGQMEVKMELAQEGTSKLIVFVEKAETLNMLQRDAAMLQKILDDAGFKTDEGSLSLNLKDGEGEGNDFASGGESGNGKSGNDELASNDNLMGGVEYKMDLSNGVIDITI